jgi:hypothetical protein
MSFLPRIKYGVDSCSNPVFSKVLDSRFRGSHDELGFFVTCYIAPISIAAALLHMGFSEPANGERAITGAPAVRIRVVHPERQPQAGP